jgi:hypothetical protein
MLHRASTSDGMFVTKNCIVLLYYSIPNYILLYYVKLHYVIFYCIVLSHVILNYIILWTLKKVSLAVENANCMVYKDCVFRLSCKTIEKFP